MATVIHTGDAAHGDIDTTMERLRDEVAASRSLAASAANAPDGLVRLTPQGRFLHVTPGVERAVGWRPEVLSGRSLASLAHPDDRPGIEERLARLIAAGDGATERLTFRARRVDARHAWLEASLRLERDPDGTVTGIVGVVRDVHDRHEAAAADRRRTSQFAALARVGRAIAAGAEGHALHAAIAGELVEALGARAVLVHAAPADAPAAPCTVAAWRDAPAEVPAPGLDEPLDGDGCVALALATGSPAAVAFADCAGDHGRGLALMWAHGLAVPVRRGDAVEGTITAVYGHEDGPPAEDAARVLAFAAELAGLACARE